MGELPKLFGKASAVGFLLPIALEKPQNAPAPNSSIWAATLGISADCALKARRTVTGGRLSANAGSPAKISQRVSVASTNCDRVENPIFSTQSVVTDRRRRAERVAP